LSSGDERHSITDAAAYEEESLASRAYVAIEEMIATLKLAPGKVVSEKMLSSVLGFGRTPVREALQQLAREGLVVILPKRGVVISEIDVLKQLKCLEVRRDFERWLAGAAARRAREDERNRFSALAAEMETDARNDDGESFLAHDREFNQLLQTAARNELAAAMMKLVQGLSRRFWFAHYKEFANLANEVATAHARVARAIAAGSEEEAKIMSDRLFDDAVRLAKATLSPDSQ
jgi:DNA-binding GntR family transcriptional regulator